MMKSLVLVFWTAWEWGPVGRPDIQVLATSYSQPNVLRDNIKLRRLVESDKYQALWQLKLRDDQNAKGKFENTASGFSEARPFSSMTGGRGDRVKIDDPHSTETAESDTERQAAVRIFREGISDRLNDVTTSAIVLIMQRLHEQDVAAVAKELDIGFIHLNLPMEFEPDTPCRTYVDGELFFEDPRTEEGELLFPERFPPQEIERLSGEANLGGDKKPACNEANKRKLLAVPAIAKQIDVALGDEAAFFAPSETRPFLLDSRCDVLEIHTYGRVSLPRISENAGISVFQRSLGFPPLGYVPLFTYAVVMNDSQEIFQPPTGFQIGGSSPFFPQDQAATISDGGLLYQVQIPGGNRNLDLWYVIYRNPRNPTTLPPSGTERVFIGNDAGTFKMRVSKSGFTARHANRDQCVIHEDKQPLIPVVSGVVSLGASAQVDVGTGIGFAFPPKMLNSGNIRMRLNLGSGVIRFYNNSTPRTIRYAIYNLP